MQIPCKASALGRHLSKASRGSGRCNSTENLKTHPVCGTSACRQRHALPLEPWTARGATRAPKLSKYGMLVAAEGNGTTVKASEHSASAYPSLQKGLTLPTLLCSATTQATQGWKHSPIKCVRLADTKLYSSNNKERQLSLPAD